MNRNMHVSKTQGYSFNMFLNTVNLYHNDYYWRHPHVKISRSVSVTVNDLTKNVKTKITKQPQKE